MIRQAIMHFKHNGALDRIMCSAEGIAAFLAGLGTYSA